MPMIKDPATLLSDAEVAAIYSPAQQREGFSIGHMIKEEIPVELPWKRLFNSHIGIFGNTGSGKSNTLAKLFTTLFARKYHAIDGVSRFVIIDFNGEYAGDQLVPAAAKSLYALSTQAENGPRFPLAPSEFWELETLAVLFQATSFTQRPFLSRLVQGRRRYGASPQSLSNYIRATFKRGLSSARPKPESLDLIRSVARLIGGDRVVQLLESISWFSRDSKFTAPPDLWFNADGANYDVYLGPEMEEINVGGADAFTEFQIRAHLQLINDLSLGYVQFEHIQPLIKRVEASLSSLSRVLDVRDATTEEQTVTVVSLKRCNSEVKKLMPLLLAKHYYNAHKDQVAQPPDRTIHLIIDEAHNILSLQSVSSPVNRTLLE